MRGRMLVLMMVVGLLMGALAVPAAAQGKAADSQGKGCPFIGESWSGWAQLGPYVPHPENEDFNTAVGPWTSWVASSGSVPDGYEEAVGISEVEDGTGVISRVIAAYCDELAPQG